MDKENITIKLLLVDDEEDFRRATATALSRRGFTVTDASNGDEALAAIKHQRPEVVVLEIAKVMEIK